MLRQFLGVLLVCAAIAVARPAAASSILINGSFELGPPMNGLQDVDVVAGSSAIPGWDVFGVSIDYLGPPWDVADGIHAVDLDGRNAVFSGVQQTFPTVLGQRYDVSFDLSGNPSGGPQVKHVLVTVDSFLRDYTFDTIGQSVANLTWDPIAFSFIASGSSATLSFLSLQATPNSYGPLIDHVSVAAPEPISIGLLGIGLVGVLARRRTRSSAKTAR